MAKKGKDPDLNEERSIVKMPPPLGPAEHIQAAMAARGIGPDKFKIDAVERKPDANGRDSLEYTVRGNLPAEEARKLVKLLTVKPFGPDKDTVTIGNSEAKLVSVEELPETERSVKLWTGKERGKRSKPKGDTPDFP